MGSVKYSPKLWEKLHLASFKPTSEAGPEQKLKWALECAACGLQRTGSSHSEPTAGAPGNQPHMLSQDSGALWACPTTLKSVPVTHVPLAKTWRTRCVCCTRACCMARVRRWQRASKHTYTAYWAVPLLLLLWAGLTHLIP